MGINTVDQCHSLVLNGTKYALSLKLWLQNKAWMSQDSWGGGGGQSGELGSQVALNRQEICVKPLPLF